MLVAGTGFPGATWPPEVVEPLARDFRVITFDHRGTGATPGTPGPYATRTFAADAIALLRELRAVPAHVLGHSMGGRVAQWMALDAPDVVSSLILAASGPGPFRADRAHVRGVPPATRQRLEQLGYEGYIATHIRETFFTPEFAAAHAERVAWLVCAFGEHRPTLGNYLKHVAARQRHRTTHLLDRLRLPTLVLVGDRDTHEGGTGSHREQSQYLMTRLPNAELRVIPGASHGMFWEKPQETVQAIREWVAGAAFDATPLARRRVRGGARHERDEPQQRDHQQARRPDQRIVRRDERDERRDDDKQRTRRAGKPEARAMDLLQEHQ